MPWFLLILVKKKKNYLGMYHQSKCKVFNSERSLMLCVHALNRSIGEEVHVLWTNHFKTTFPSFNELKIVVVGQ